MNWILLALGVLLTGAAALDSLWTTLWVDGGAGPIARRILMATRRSLRAVFRAGRHPRLSLAGPLSITATLGVWVIMTWLGWSLIFFAGEHAVVDQSDGVPGGFNDHIYFVAYTIFTVGYGEFVPNGPGWQVLTGIASINGLALVTLALTYMITVLSAVVKQRALASHILDFGPRPQDLLLTAWNRGRFEGLDATLDALAEAIGQSAERRLAYPILHAYHSADREKSVSVAIAVLDEALTLLRFGVAPEARPAALSVAAARASVASYFDTLPSQDVREADEVPPMPSLQPLCEAGIPTVDDATFEAAVEQLSARRRLLLGNLTMDDWEWPSVTGHASGQND